MIPQNGLTLYKQKKYTNSACQTDRLCLISMALFQDELDEKPRSVRAKSVFGVEPEETSKPTRTKTTVTQPRRLNLSLFGAEPDEATEPSTAVASSSASPSKLPQTIHVDWTSMQLFASATFLKKTVETTKSVPAKRPYDNTKRSENAAGIERASYSDMALNPDRLTGLKAQPHCKCILAEDSNIKVCDDVFLVQKHSLDIISKS